MKIDKIGEFGLIEKIRHRLPTDSSVIKGIGDDCAVLSYKTDKYLLFTCDMLIEGKDFLPKDRPFLVGRKAIAASLSDIAAKGGIPRHCLISLGLPEKKDIRYVQELYRGLSYWAKIFKVNIVGGDLSSATKVIIDVCMIGLVEKEKLVLRSTARKGDFIFVSGSLGGTRKNKHLAFSPRLKEARYLVNNYKINSMIDISDGLLADLGHILKQSRKGAVLFERMIPLASESGGLKDALCAGEDFELLFTLPAKEARFLLARKKDFYLIGFVTAGKEIIMVDRRGRQKKLKPAGFTHF